MEERPSGDRDVRGSNPREGHSRFFSFLHDLINILNNMRYLMKCPRSSVVEHQYQRALVVRGSIPREGLFLFNIFYRNVKGIDFGYF